MQKPAVTQTKINDIIANRWSGRAYDATKPVTEMQIISMLEAARWAPSCYGDQPWRFIVFNKNSNAAAWQKALDCIGPGNQAWAKNAPVLVLVCANTLFNHNQEPNRWGSYDTGAAAVSLCLQAASLDLMTHQMGGFDGGKARAAFNVPVEYQLMSMLSVGHAFEADNVPEELKERESAARKRNALGELFYNGVWDRPII